MDAEILPQMCADHPLSKEVRALGLSEQEQSEIRFFKPNESLSLEAWAYTFPPDWDYSRFRLFEGYLKPCAALNWALHENPLPRRSEAFAVVNDFITTKLAHGALRYNELQRNKARKPRGKVSEDGETLSDVVAALITRPELKDAKLSELWDHLHGELDRHHLSPRDIEHTTDQRKDCYEYTTHHGVKTIRRATFYNLVSKIKKI